MIVRVIDLTGHNTPITMRVDDDTRHAELLDGAAPTNVQVHALSDDEYHAVHRRR